MGVPPNQPFIDGFSLKNNSFWGTPFGNLHKSVCVYMYIYIYICKKHVADLNKTKLLGLWGSSFGDISG